MTIPHRYESLGDFLALLEKRKQLQRIHVEVDADQELAAITDRVAKTKNGGPGLFFEQVTASAWPLAVNLFGSAQRCAWALGTEQLADLSFRLKAKLSSCNANSAAERLLQLLSGSEFDPELVAEPSCREVVEKSSIDLTELPLLRNFPADGGRNLTLPLVITDDPDTGQTNCGIYRSQIISSDRLIIHWRNDSDGGRNFHKYLESGQKMPVSIALGGDPALLFSAAMRLPGAIDEVRFAGYLRDAPLSVASCLTNSLIVPASAEVVLEGEVVADEFHAEGPFGNHTGSYQPQCQCPVIRITALTRRHQPIIPATIVGRPPMEDCYLAKALERLLLPLLQIDHPVIRDLCMPLEAIFHGCALLAVASTSAADHRQLLNDVATGPWLGGSQLIVLFDQQVDVHDAKECFWRAVNNVDYCQDVIQIGKTVAIDATRINNQNPLCSRSVEIEQRVTQRWKEYGLERLLNGK